MKPAQLWKCLLSTLLLAAAHSLAASQWDESAAALAQKIGAVLGAGQARLEVRNQSSLSLQDVAVVRGLLESDLKQRGIVVAGDESANEVRVTLSENASQRIWLAEIVQGTETKVVMTLAGPLKNAVMRSQAGILLQATPLLSSVELSGKVEERHVEAPILSVAGDDAGLVVLQGNRVSFFESSTPRFAFLQTLSLPRNRAMPRDPRGRVFLHPDGQTFSAYLPGQQCEGTRPTRSGNHATASVHCKDTDDPWPLAAESRADLAPSASFQRAFYNSTRNYFTGVVTPALTFELPPFFDAVALPRGGGTAMLVHETSGAVELIEGTARKAISGARDWGSDIAVLQSRCSVDPIVLVSASGEAVRDSLRAYAIPAQEAVPTSAPLAVDGTVMAMTQLNDGSAAVIVRMEDGDGWFHDEVLRVSTLCN